MPVISSTQSMSIVGGLKVDEFSRIDNILASLTREANQISTEFRLVITMDADTKVRQVGNEELVLTETNGELLPNQINIEIKMIITNMGLVDNVIRNITRNVEGVTEDYDMQVTGNTIEEEEIEEA